MESQQNEWNVYKTTWLLEDQLEEYKRILGDANVEFIESKLVEYVKENIEPIGWTALWRPNDLSKFLSIPFEKSVDFIVDVMNVSREYLEATVIIKLITDKAALSYDQCMAISELISSKKQLYVPLQQLYPLVEQENNLIDVAITAEVLDQVRFFYNYIWRPWDTHEECCTYNSLILRERLKLHESMESGCFSPSIMKNMKSVLREAGEIQHKIINLEDETISDFIDELQVIELTKLHKKMDLLKISFGNLTDPTKRMISAHQQQIERIDLLHVTLTDVSKDVFMVADAIPVVKFVSISKDLPQLLKELPNISEEAVIRSFSSLQTALDSAIAGTTIIVLTGVHSIMQLGTLASGGTICGLGDNVVIEGNVHTGDSIFDLAMNEETFHLKNLCLKPMSHQAAIISHSGKLLIQNCDFLDASSGVQLLGESSCEMNACNFINCSSYGVECRSRSKMSVLNCIFENCSKAAMKKQKDATISLTGKIDVRNCPREMIEDDDSETTLNDF